MTRINTNVSALIANQNLTNSNNEMQVTLERLSTGLRINSAADDPSGLMAATNLGANIANSNQAISNSQFATQMISTADSALSQISQLLTTIDGLVTEAANTAAMSTSQIAANQSQIDSSLSAINSIAQTTTFQGLNLLNGSLALQTTPGTNYPGTVQNLNVTQVNFGTASSVPVDINVTALAKQAQITATVNDGVAGDLTATSTVGFHDGSSINITAPTSGASTNGMQVAFQESSTITAGTAVASFDSATQTLNITVSKTGTTSAQTIADAINSDTDFTAKASTALATSGYVAGTDTPVNANTTITAADGGSLSVSALAAGTAGNADKVKFVEGDATNGPAVSFNAATSTLTVTINDANHNAGQTSLASVAAAINNFKDSTGHYAFSATVNTAGSFETAPVASTGVAPDGVAVAAEAPSTTIFTSVPTPADTFTISALGATANNATVIVNQVTGQDSATWDPTANNGDGVLTINLSTTGGTAGTYTAAQISALVASASAQFSVTGTSWDAAAGGDFGAVTSLNEKVGGGGGSNAGVTGTGNNLNAAAGGTTLANGAGVSGEFGVAAGNTNGTGVAGLTANLDLQVGGNAGGQLFSFTAGTTAEQMSTALNQASNNTGVQATAIGDQLVFNSIGYGSAATTSVQVVNEGTGGTFKSSLSANNATGTDIGATVNGVAATGHGNTVTLDTPSLGFTADLDPTKLTAGENVNFNVTGGGAVFQLGPTVTSAEQYNLGIQSVDTSTLGGTVGHLYEIGSGYDASLTSNTTKAAQIIQAALNNISSLRGQLGAFQTATIDTNISALNSAVTNLTAAQSSIKDADFATESANLSREQILVQSGTTVAGIASATPANVLSLLQKAAQV